MRLFLTPEAEADLENLHTFIAEVQQQPIVVNQVVERIHAAHNRIALNPLIGRKTDYPDTRQLVTAGVPLTIVYRIAGEVIQVITIYLINQGTRTQNASRKTAE